MPQDPGKAAARDYAFRVYAVDDSDEVRLMDLWQIVWRGKWLIVACAVGLAFLAAISTYLITPVYRASVLVAPTSETSGGTGLAALAGQFAGVAALTGLNLGGNNRTAEAVATLRSRAFTEKFINERGLLPILYADRWDAGTRQWRDESGEPPSMWAAYELFNSLRSIDEDVTTGLYKVDVNWTDPQLAAEWANGLIGDVNGLLRTRAIGESRQNLDFLRSELEKNSQVQLQTTIFGLIEAEMQNAMLANVKQEYAFKIIDPAKVPEKTHWPKRLLITLLGFGAGLVIGMFAAVVRAPARGALQAGRSIV
jgi:uncharacterized protein involved in exopolysaccharide biosynthesis